MLKVIRWIVTLLAIAFLLSQVSCSVTTEYQFGNADVFVNGVQLTSSHEDETALFSIGNKVVYYTRNEVRLLDVETANDIHLIDR